MADKRKPDSVMNINIDGKTIDLAIFLGEGFKSFRYELTAEQALEPLDTAFCLWLLVKSMCIDAGIEPDVLIKTYGSDPSSDTKH